MTTLAPGDARSRLEMAVELLAPGMARRLSRGHGVSDRPGQCAPVAPAAASEQIADDLSRVIDDLDAYTTLPRERRPAALMEIATAIKRLIPEVARLDRPARPMNVLDTARPVRKTSDRQRASQAATRRNHPRRVRSPGSN